MRHKYPRTYHFPWSLGVEDDDKIAEHFFDGLEVVVTVKYDGENCNLYSDGLHARSLDSNHKPWQDWVRRFWSERCHDLPKGWRVCGENMWAKHSIYYSDLPSFFLGFSIWNEHNYRLSWAETLEWFDLLGISPVQEIWRGVYDEQPIRRLWTPSMQNTMEGFVVQTVEGFHYHQFGQYVRKFVRPNHVQTSDHWAHQQITSNRLKTNIGDKV